MPQKLLSIAIPSYNSEAYVSHAVESLLPGGLENRDGLNDLVEILIVNDGSKDGTAAIADDWERRFPGVIRAVHKENGGHGDAVMTGLRNATGLYFKVVDSDDWVDAEAYPKVLETLRSFSAPGQQLDLLICNYIYDKVGQEHKHVMQYHSMFPVGRVFGWADCGPFRLGHYLLMHSVIYRTELLIRSGLDLPKHTFYVDELYVYTPLPHVERMYYLDVNFYHYFIGRDDQSVQEEVMIRRIDQALRVNRLMITSVDLSRLDSPQKYAYLRNYLEIVTTVSSVLLTKSGTEENLKKKEELWAFLKQERPEVYRDLRHRFLGRAIHLKGAFGRWVLLTGYRISQKVVGFN